MKPNYKAVAFTRFSTIFQCVLYWGMFLFLLFLLSSLLGSFFPVQWNRFTYGILGTIAAITTTWIFLKKEKRSFRSYGLIWERKTFLKFLIGLAIGTFIFALIIVVLLAFTELQLLRNKEPGNLLSAFWYLAIVPLALMEEIAFRSYTFLKLDKVFGLRITQIIVSIAFALYHIVQGWSMEVAFLGPAIWAFVFGLSAAWSGGIAVPTGIHVALNVLQPLTGMKTGNYYPLWHLDYKAGTSEAMIARADNIGLSIQFIILISSIVLTELYIRKRNYTAGKSIQAFEAKLEL